MFKLSNVENKVELELSVEGYQFPKSPKDDWCFVKIIVKQGADTFKAIDPALETTELLRIRITRTPTCFRKHTPSELSPRNPHSPQQNQ